MNTLQFNIDEDLGYSPISPDVIDISSESGEESIVEPGNIAQLYEKFRIFTLGSNIMTAFAGLWVLQRLHCLLLLHLLCLSYTLSLKKRVCLPAERSEIRKNSYGRSFAAILPATRISRQQSSEIVRPIPTYPPNFSQESSNFQQVRTINLDSQRITNFPTHEPKAHIFKLRLSQKNPNARL